MISLGVLCGNVLFVKHMVGFFAVHLHYTPVVFTWFSYVYFICVLFIFAVCCIYGSNDLIQIKCMHFNNVTTTSRTEREIPPPPRIHKHIAKI